MLQYKFYKNEIGTPQLEILGDLQGLTELGSCSEEYLNEIVVSLQKVISGEINQYDFGFEVYSIECKMDIAQVIDTYKGWKSISTIPTKEIYELMRGWKEYLQTQGG